eukprot:Gb_06966 [translate_table: standard]
MLMIEAQANAVLADVMPFNPSDHPLLSQLIPNVRAAVELLLIQVLLQLRTSAHHHISDGIANGVLLNGWSKVVRGQPIHSSPAVHERSVLMARDPPHPVYDHMYEYKGSLASLAQLIGQQTCVNLAVRTLHFSVDCLNQLKKNASQDVEKPYSKFQSLMAHLWRCITKA